MKQRGIDPQNIMVYGHSIGGTIGIHLAVHQPDARGLIVQVTVTSIADMARRDYNYRIFPLGACEKGMLQVFNLT